MRFRHPVTVRFRDLDALGHVHHSEPLMYLEEARAAYWRAVAGRSTVADIDYVMGDVSLRYHRSIHYPATLEVALRVSEIGTKSFRMEYEIRGADGELLVSASSVQVLYDYARGASVPVPPELRARIEKYEQGVRERPAPFTS